MRARSALTRERRPAFIRQVVAEARRLEAQAGRRVVATLMFTDIVGSTELALRLGDARWAELLSRHDAAVREEVLRHGGRVVKSLGDGALTAFDGPSRALGCALAVGERMRELGLRVRAGLHAGELDLLGEDVSGIAVHIAARIAALAGAGEVLASGTVRDLAVGSAFALESRGELSLRGVGEPWRVYAVAVGGAGAPQPASSRPVVLYRDGSHREGGRDGERSEEGGHDLSRRVGRAGGAAAGARLGGSPAA